LFANGQSARPAACRVAEQLVPPTPVHDAVNVHKFHRNQLQNRCLSFYARAGTNLLGRRVYSMLTQNQAGHGAGRGGSLGFRPESSSIKEGKFMKKKIGLALAMLTGTGALLAQSQAGTQTGTQTGMQAGSQGSSRGTNANANTGTNTGSRTTGTTQNNSGDASTTGTGQTGNNGNDTTGTGTTGTGTTGTSGGAQGGDDFGGATGRNRTFKH
jgi:hypothetical protein